LTPKQPVARPSKERASPFSKEENKKYLTDVVFLIGNGNSRKTFDLEQLRPLGTIIGCNAIFRDFSPDILLAIDAKMLKEIKKSDYCRENTCIIPGARSVAIPGSFRFRTDKFNTTGCFGMKMISQLMKPKKCYMLGMDGYPGNMYDGTANYAPNTLKNFKGVNTYYLKVLQGVGETIYINVNEKDTWPKACHDTGKYEFMSIQDFKTKVLCLTF